MVHVTPQDFGAVADGSDCTSAIQQALDAVCASGGTLRFPDGKYGVTSQISGTTDKTVNIIGSMGTGEESYIKVNAPITGSVIQLSSAGGEIRGLRFYDDPGETSSGIQGGNTVTGAALELVNYSQGTVEKCRFDYIKGSAIKAINLQRSNLSGNYIRGCGDVGNSAVDFASANSTGPIVQATNFSENKIESCVGAPYVRLNALTADVKLIGNQFEADTNIAATNQVFVETAGHHTQFIGNRFSRNDNTSVVIEGANAILTGDSFESQPTMVGARQLHVKAGGAYATVTGVHFVGSAASTGISIDASSAEYVSFSGCSMYMNGAVLLGDHCTWTGGSVANCRTTKPYAITIGSYCTVSGLTMGAFDGPGKNLDCGGIIIAGNGSTATGNVITGMGGHGLVSQTPANILKGNVLAGNGAAGSGAGVDLYVTNPSRGFRPEDNVYGTSNGPLAGRTVHDASGSTTAPSGVPTTIFAVPATPGLHEVSIWIGGEGGAYTAVATIMQSGASGAAPILLRNNAGSANVAISLSGPNVQVTQSGVSGATVWWDYSFYRAY
ncbi:hypothetical protein [Sphingomonas sp. UNC305MFCol5.2]|uniref:hypothetical protein n=1 Tax=Sphingomonas sp. UNC305MFCol5.2 TaxID=1449076 RepID=UPI00040B2DA4|nr:hypothetical protein [Sphingomonas sp. UNC305MFCol5.2]